MRVASLSSNALPLPVFQTSSRCQVWVPTIITKFSSRFEPDSDSGSSHILWTEAPLHGLSLGPCAVHCRITWGKPHTLLPLVLGLLCNLSKCNLFQSLPLPKQEKSIFPAVLSHWKSLDISPTENTCALTHMPTKACTEILSITSGVSKTLWWPSQCNRSDTEDLEILCLTEETASP